jgi:hypothetical protein
VDVGPRIFDLCTNWSGQLHAPAALLQGKELIGSQNRPRCGEGKNLDPTGTRTPTSRLYSPYPSAKPTALSWLLSLKPIRNIVVFAVLCCCLGYRSEKIKRELKLKLSDKLLRKFVYVARMGKVKVKLSLSFH